MANEFVRAKTQIARVVSDVTGIRQALVNPGETQNEYPFAAIYLASGNLGAGAQGTRKSLYNVVVDVLTRRINLPDDLALLDPFVDSLPAALLAEVSGDGERFEQTISTFDEITMQFIPMTKYAEVEMIGYRFILNDVKILANS